MLKNYSLNRLLVLLTTLGFLFLTVDSLLEHWEILTQDLPAFIPVLFSAAGLVIGIMAPSRLPAASGYHAAGDLGAPMV